MSEFGTLAAKLKAIDTFEILRNILQRKEIRAFIINTPKNRIQKTGIAADGTKLRTDKAEQGEVYSAFTIFDKEDQSGISGITNHVTFTQSGKFWRDVFMRVEKASFIVDSIFQKPEGNMYDNFTFQFGSDKEFEDAVLGLNESEKDRLAELIYPHFIREFNLI